MKAAGPAAVHRRGGRLPRVRGRTVTSGCRCQRRTHRVFPSIFLFTDTLLVFDHLQHVIKVVSHVRLDGDIEASYRQAAFRIDELVERLGRPLVRLPYDVKLPRTGNSQFVSNHTKEDFMLKVERARGVHLRGRHLPDPGVAAVFPKDRRASVRDLPRPADGEPVALHVLPRTGRDARGGGLTRDAHPG